MRIYPSVASSRRVLVPARGLLALLVCGTLLSILVVGCVPLIYYPTATPWPVTQRPSPRPTQRPTATVTNTAQPPSPIPQPTGTATPEPTPPSVPRPLALNWPEQELALLDDARDTLRLLDDPTYYVMDVTIDVNEAKVSGEANIHYTNNETVEFSEIPLRLFPNSDASRGGCTNVFDAMVDGQVVTPRFELSNTVMWLPLDSPLLPEKSIDIGVLFDVCVPLGDGRNFSSFAAKQGVIALAHFYPFVPVYDEEGWNIELAPYYGDILHADISLYDVTVTVDEDVTVVTTGMVVSEGDAGEGDTIRRFVSGPARDFNIVLSHQYSLVQDEVDGVKVNSYYLPDREEGGKEVLDVAKEALHIFNQRFGPYPYTEFDVVATFTSAAGVEYPGLVVIADRLYEGNGRSEWVVAHEVGHQWWYNMVGNDQVDDPWLDEALTQYSTVLYYEDRYGTKSGASAIQNGLWSRWETARDDGRDRAVAGPVASFSVEDYGAIVYGKGALFFDALRERLGDARFDEVLRVYFEQHLWRIATPESFLAAAETVSIQQLDDLYEEWILSPAGQ